MFEELDKVTLTRDIKDHNLKEGDRGTIVHVYGKGEGYEVEFFNAKGNTLAVLTLVPRDLRLYANKDEYVSQWFTKTLSGMALNEKEEHVWKGLDINQLLIKTATPKVHVEEPHYYPTIIV